jgi:ABC-type Na+ efflux pump permease subunit
LAIAAFTWLFVVFSREPPRQMGTVLFWVLGVGSFVASLFMGMMHTADCLSEEKREGTLGLLFLTDLKGYDVVLGKLAASSLNAIYGVLAILPVLAVPLLMGGVAPAEFGRLVLVIVNSLFQSLAAGVFASSLVRSGRSAASLTFGLVLLLNGLSPALGLYVHHEYQLQRFPEGFLVPSAGFACAAASDPLYRAGPAQFWYSVAFTHGAAWGLLVLAGIITRNSWQERAPGMTWQRLKDGWRRLLYGRREQRDAFRQQLLEVNPSFWLLARHRFKPWLVWAAFAFVGASWLLGYWEFEQDWVTMPIYVMTALLLHLLLRAWLASEAVQCLGPDRRSGALELLLSTPLSVRDLLRGHQLALQRQFLKPALFVLGLDILFLLVGLDEVHGDQERFLWIGFWLVVMAVLLADMQTIAWLSMWFGLVARQASRAAGQSILIVLVVPWLLFLLFLTALYLVGVDLPNDPQGFFMVTYTIIGLGVDAMAWRWARGRLLRDLRTLAVQRAEAHPSLWARFRGRTLESTPPAVS